MYTKRPIQPTNEPLRLPEHYSGVTFSRKRPTVPEPIEEAPPAQTYEETKEAETPKDESVPTEEVAIQEEKKELPTPKKQSSLLGISGREDILLLILALLLLDDEGGDDTLAYILLGLLVLG